MIVKQENRKQSAESPRLLEEHLKRGFFPCRQREAGNHFAGLLLACCSPRIKGLLNLVLLLSALFAAPGCALLDHARVDSAQHNQAAFEKMVARQNYHKAAIYLDEIKDESGVEFYELQQQRLVRLSKELERDVEQKAVGRAGLDDFIGAVTLVEQALKKIPESKKLLQLSEKLEQERRKRLTANDRNMLLGKAEYLLSRLEWYEEQARLEKPSLMTRWLMSRKEKALVGLYPDLLDCGQQASKLAEYIVAEKCLQMAKKINDSEPVRQMLSQIDDSFSEEESVSYEECVVLLSVTKKSKPAAALLSLFLELEKEFKQELAKGELLKAYESLAKLEKFPGREEQLEGYRQQLDKAKESRIAEQLEEGASLYRRGKISEARIIWQKVLALDPQNQTAIEKVARADKVLKNIQELQKVQ